MWQRAVILLCLAWVLVATGTVWAELVGHWPLNEGTGGQVTDATGRGHNGTINGATWVSPGWNGKGTCLQFDGTNDVAEVPHADDLRFGANAAYTVAAWVNMTVRPGRWSGIVTKGRETGNWYGIWVDTSNLWVFGHQPNNQLGSQVVPGVWVHVAMVYDNANKKIYLDGVLDNETTASASGDNTGDLWFGAAKGVTEFAPARIDDIRIYNHALTVDEIEKIRKGLADAPIAYDPDPEDGAVDVPRDVVLGWTAGEFAATHDVYLGTAFDDVNDAGRASPGSVLAGQGQAAMEHDPEGLLEYGQTYYWRIDEVNAAPDDTIFKGEVWHFTVEPFAYPITGVTATASSAQPGMDAQNTVNGSGLNANDEHSTELTQMWMSSGVLPNWIQYEFDAPYKLHELWVWNSNQLIEPYIGFGAKSVSIEYSVDGETWTSLEGVPEFARGPGSPTYRADTIVDFGGAMAQYVKLTINGTWGGVAPQASLSEVRFFYVPVQAREPQPGVAATDVSVDAELNWRPGREATSHEVYFGADENAMTLVDTVTEHSYTPAAMDFGTTYSWKVNEVGDAGTYEGNVWSFTTQEYATIDDMESYNDDDNRIYDSWVDGWVNNTGSQVGYDVSPFAEKTIVHGGVQSLPLHYDNTASPFVSEAERTFATAQNWALGAADTLSVHFQGAAPAFVETASGILMSAIGTDIWNNGDQFRFVYKTLNGNGTMIARVESIFQSDVWAKGGVMIRQSIEPGSTHAFMPITPSGGNGASFQHRLATNGASTNNDSTTVVAAPYWVKIERSGNNFTGSISPDGATWTPLGTPQTITMTNPVLIGLALCSHNAAIATGAEFSNISTTGNVTGNWQVAEIGVEQPAGNSIEPLYVTIADSSGKTKTVANPDAAATGRTGWQQWKIPLSEFTSAGVKMNAVKTMTIGVGNKAAPTAGGTGLLYLDDIGFGRPAPGQ